MYLMFLTPHKCTPLAVFDFIYPTLFNWNGLSIIILISLIGILFFSILHFYLLYINFKSLSLFKKEENYEEFTLSNKYISSMAIPLSLSMTFNVIFVLGVTFIPHLWSKSEYLFPFALIGFTITGIWSLNILINHFTRIFLNGGLESDKNNNLSQLISIFTFAMVAVGFAAPGAMSHTFLYNILGLLGSVVFTSIALLLLFIKFTIGVKNMFTHGINQEGSPSLWIIIPILTILGITYIRLLFGFEHHLQGDLDKTNILITFTSILTIQTIFAIIGYKVMTSNNYFTDYIYGDKKSDASFALICPGVAMFVFGLFFINYGLVYSEVIEKYSLLYYLLHIPFILIQIKTIDVFFRLNKKHKLL